MKALMGKLVKTIKSDPQGNKELKNFIAQGSTSSSDTITLSDGKKYRISTTPKATKVA